MGNCCEGETKENKKPSIEAISITHSEFFVKSASELEPRAEIPKEKRWQSTRRSPPRVPTLEQKKALAVAATNTKRARAATAKLAGAAAYSRGRAVQEAAAVVIQSAFRSYLARKALRALKGLVKVQALVRGHLVRKRTTATIQRMQSLLTVQARARAQRTRQSGYQEMDRGTDENIRIVEMDLVGSNRSTSSIKSLSNRGSSSSTPNRAYSKQEFRDLSLIKPSAHVGSRPRAQSMRYDDYNFDTAKSSPRDYNVMASPYAENTEPFRVKKLGRSLSAPKTGAGSVTGASSRKKATQAGLRLDSNVDPWLAKLARISGAAKKGNHGSSSGTSHTRTYRPWQN